MKCLLEAEYSWSYRDGTFTCVRKFFEWLYFNNHVKDNFFVTAKQFVTRPPKPVVEPKYVQLEVALKLIETAETQLQSPETYGEKRLCCLRDAAIMALLLTTGMRRDEICRLNVDNITFRHTVDDDNNEFEEMDIFIVGKYKRERRQFTIDTTAIRLVRNWLDNRPDLGNEKAVFITIHGHASNTKRLSPWSINSRLDYWSKQAGYSKDVYVSPHGWRHLYGAYFMENTDDFRALQKLMGHSNSSTTEIYAHISTKAIRKKSRMYAPRIDNHR